VIRVDVRVDAALMVFCDESQLRRLVQALLSNSAEALAGGEVESPELVVSAANLDEGVALWVQDNGPGIEPHLRERVFDVLYTTRNHGGGLGLPLARRIAAAHGGTLSVEDTAAGARLRLLLPHRNA
jgi:signal transduction histidine kinase